MKFKPARKLAIAGIALSAAFALSVWATRLADQPMSAASLPQYPQKPKIERFVSNLKRPHMKIIPVFDNVALLKEEKAILETKAEPGIPDSGLLRSHVARKSLPTKIINKDSIDMSNLDEMGVDYTVSMLDSVPCSVKPYQTWKEFVICNIDTLRIYESRFPIDSAAAFARYPDVVVRAEVIRRFDIFPMMVLVHEAGHNFTNKAGIMNGAGYGSIPRVTQRVERQAYSFELRFLRDLAKLPISFRLADATDAQARNWPCTSSSFLEVFAGPFQVSANRGSIDVVNIARYSLISCSFKYGQKLIAWENARAQENYLAVLADGRSAYAKASAQCSEDVRHFNQAFKQLAKEIVGERHARRMNAGNEWVLFTVLAPFLLVLAFTSERLVIQTFAGLKKQLKCGN